MQHVCHVYEGTDAVQLLSLTKLNSRLFQLPFHWLKLLTDDGGEETGVRFRKCHILLIRINFIAVRTHRFHVIHKGI